MCHDNSSKYVSRDQVASQKARTKAAKIFFNFLWSRGGVRILWTETKGRRGLNSSVPESLHVHMWILCAGNAAGAGTERKREIRGVREERDPGGHYMQREAHQLFIVAPVYALFVICLPVCSQTGSLRRSYLSSSIYIIRLPDSRDFTLMSLFRVITDMLKQSFKSCLILLVKSVLSTFTWK